MKLVCVIHILCISYLMYLYSPQANKTDVELEPKGSQNGSDHYWSPVEKNLKDFLTADYIQDNLFVKTLIGTNILRLKILKKLRRGKRFIKHIRPYLPRKSYFGYKIFDIVLPIILEMITNVTLSSFNHVGT